MAYSSKYLENTMVIVLLWSSVALRLALLFVITLAIAGRLFFGGNGNGRMCVVTNFLMNPTSFDLMDLLKGENRGSITSFIHSVRMMNILDMLKLVLIFVLFYRVSVALHECCCWKQLRVHRNLHMLVIVYDCWSCNLSVICGSLCEKVTCRGRCKAAIAGRKVSEERRAGGQ